MRLVALGCVAVLGCGSGSAASSAPSALKPGGGGPVTSLVGELHLHQFPYGSHTWAAFLGDEVPLSAFRGDAVTEIDTAVTAVEGPCTLYVIPTCSPDCGTTDFCEAPNHCEPLPQWQYIDGGNVQVTGSTIVPTIRFWWDAPSQTYLTDPPPGAPHVFAGGEQLYLSGGSGDYATVGELPAPLAVAVTAPDMNQLMLPVSGALAITWTSVQSDQMEVLISASGTNGATTDIRCITGDTGGLTIPADFVAALPPPPRLTRLEVVRVEQRILPLARQGWGMLVHSAQSTWANGRD